MSAAVQAMVEKELLGKRILIWGAGREGASTCRFLQRYLPQQPIAVADGQPPDPQVFTGCQYLPTADWNSDFEEFDVIIKSPGIPIGNPAIKRELLSSQTQLFFSCFRDQVIGITGTKGKSTTASLIAHILRETRGNTLLVGNIGLPCLDWIDKVEENTAVVFELSCHQLECVSVSPHIGVILNLYEDHLDHYGTYEAYVHAKENIFRYQRPGDCIILNQKDHIQIAKAHAPLLAAMDEQGDIGVSGPAGEKLHIPGETLVLSPEDTRLPGRHNRYNIAIAYYICRRLGVGEADFVRHLATFQGLPHRLQYVATVNGVAYYDDSISTICETTIQALQCLPNVGTVLIGGMDRGIDYQPLVDFLLAADVDNIILMPDTNSRILELMKASANSPTFLSGVISVASLEEAVDSAKKRTAPGKACLLSPAAASYGFFRNFEERGDRFAQLVTANDSLSNPQK